MYHSPANSHAKSTLRGEAVRSALSSVGNCVVIGSRICDQTVSVTATSRTMPATLAGTGSWYWKQGRATPPASGGFGWTLLSNTIELSTGGFTAAGAPNGTNGWTTLRYRLKEPSVPRSPLSQ